MSSEKYVQLVNRLVTKTKADTAAWEPTSRDGVFALSFPDYTIRITRVRNEGEPDTWDVMFQIVNSNGALIDSFRDVDVAPHLPDSQRVYREMEELYQSARRRALGVDQALDKLLDQLG